MRAFITGATGFIGGAVADRLLDEGWDVTALVRSPSKAGALRARGATIAPGDVTDPARITAALGAGETHAVFHLAAWYALGARDRARMESINVGGTKNVLRAAADADVASIVYCSSVAALGPNPAGEVGDESKVHDGVFGSLYEETKHRAHVLAHWYAADGAPVVTVLPGAVYGPGDASLMGLLIRLYARKLLVVCPFPDAGVSFVHVDDVAAGVVAAAERGTSGEDYILGGENVAILDMFRRAASATGIRAPRAGIKASTMARFTFASPAVAKVMRQEPDLLKDAAANMRGSWRFSSAKAERDLDYSWRSAVDGLAQTVRDLRR